MHNAYSVSNNDKKVSCRKLVARQHSWSTDYKFRRSRSNRLGAGKLLGTLGPDPPWKGGVANALETRYCRQMCYHTKFRRCMSNRLGVIMEICQKVLTTCVPPFKVTQGHWNQHWLPMTFSSVPQ